MSSLAPYYYHGSPYRFTRFKVPNSGIDYGVGIYLTANISEATQYAFSGDEDGYLYKVYPSVVQPFETDNRRHFDILVKGLSKYKKKTGKELDFLLDNSFTSAEKDNYYLKALSLFEINRFEEKTVQEILIEKGFDSILDSRKEWLIVFNPANLATFEFQPLHINEYEFTGKIGEKQFKKKKSA